MVTRARAWAPIVALVLAGCGFGYPLAVVVSETVGGSSGKTAPPPVVQIDPVERQVGDVLVTYLLVDPTGRRANITVEYRVGGADFAEATEADDARSEGTTGLPSTTAGAPHTFVWDADFDLGDTAARADVQLRIAPQGATGQVSAPFRFGNDAPTLATDPVELEQDGLVQVTGRLTDSTGDRVRLRIEVVDRVATATIGIGDVITTTGIVAQSEANGGTAVSFAWNSLIDIPQNALVTLRMTPEDESAAGAPVDIEFLLRNNEAPSLTVLPVARQSGEVRVDFILLDRRSDPTDLEVLFTARKGAQTLGPLPITLARDSLSGFASSPEGEAGSFIWNAAADLVFAAPGGIPTVELAITASDEDGTGRTRRAAFLVGAEPPSLLFEPITRIQSGVVPIRFTLTGSGDPADVALTFTTTTSDDPRPLSLAVGTLEDLATNVDGVVHTIAWNTLLDLGAVVTQASLHAVPSIGVTGSPLRGPEANLTFPLSNTDRVAALVAVPQAGTTVDARASAVVPIEFLLFDLQNRVATARVEVNVGDGRGFHVPAGGNLQSLATSAEGRLHTFTYDLTRDGVRAADGDLALVSVRITPSNAIIGTGLAALSGAFAINLNREPQVDLIAVDDRAAAGLLLVEGTVLVDLVVRDTESDVANVSVEVSSNAGQSFAPLDVDPPIEKPSGRAETSLAFELDTSEFGRDGAEELIVRLTPRDQLDLDRSFGEGAQVLLLLVVDNDDNPAPIVTANAVAGTERGDVNVPFTLAHIFGHPCDVTVEYATESIDGPYLPATALSDVTGLATNANGTPAAFTYTWDTRADLATQRLPKAYLRVTATNVPPLGSGLPARQSDPITTILDIDNGLEADLVLGHPTFEQGAEDNQGLDRPEGVHVGGGRVWICDRMNHRVLQYGLVPTFSFQGADLVLGQAGFSRGTGSGNALALDQLVLPRAVAFDAATQRLYVADAGARVLVWNGVPRANGEAADLEIRVVSVAGVTPDLTGLDALGADLYVVDRTNHRVLRYDMTSIIASAPVSGIVTPAPAIVLGQPNATTRATGSALDALNDPVDVDVFDSGLAGGFRLVVADRANARLLVWTARPTVSRQAATFAIGAARLTGGATFSPGPVHVTSDGALFAANQASGSVLHLPAPIGNDAVAADFALASAAEPAGASTLASGSPSGLGGDDDHLLVADRDRSRVLIFTRDPSIASPRLPVAPLPARIAIGQPNLTAVGRNHTSVDPFSFDRPSGIVVTAGRLYVADTANARVLGWRAVPTAFNIGADFALGQQDLFSEIVDGTDPALATMAGPRGLAVDGNRLLVADTAASRVLIWLTPPTTSGTPADRRLANIEASSIAIAPEPSAPGDSTRRIVAIAEPYRDRVLIYRDLDLAAINNASPPTPTVRLGDPTFAGGPLPNAAQLDTPRAVWFDASGRLYVSDAGHNRVLVWNVVPDASAAGNPSALAADVALGQKDTATLGTEGEPTGTDLGGLLAGGVAAGSGVFIADVSAQRVVYYASVPALNNGTSAEPLAGLVGQSVFSTANTNDGGIGARSLFLAHVLHGFDKTPSGNPEASVAAFDEVLWITDTYNDRLLRVPAPGLVPSAP